MIYQCSECGDEFETQMQCVIHNIEWQHQNFSIPLTSIKIKINAEGIDRYLGKHFDKYP